MVAALVRRALETTLSPIAKLTVPLTIMMHNKIPRPHRHLDIICVRILLTLSQMLLRFCP